MCNDQANEAFDETGLDPEKHEYELDSQEAENLDIDAPEMDTDIETGGEENLDGDRPGCF